MSFRLRLIVVSALAVAAAIALASITSYIQVRGQLVREFDNSLKDRKAQATTPPQRSGFKPDPCFTNVTKGLIRQLGGGYFQRIEANTKVIPLPSDATRLPVSEADRRVATGESRQNFRNATVGGQEIRIYTSPLEPTETCGALQVGRSLSSLSDTLNRLAVSLLALSFGGIGLAAVFGWIIAGTTLRPVRHMTATTEHVARTRDLSRRIESRGRDELARLASSFNTMLEALEASLRSQRQLVADASHELRTPLTTAKTNIEVLLRAELPREERQAILRDVSAQIDELAVLVTDIVDLARGVEPDLEVEEVRLDLLVEQTVERARRLSPGCIFQLELEPCLMRGVPSRLERAVANLLDNACKWSPAGAPIEVTVTELGGLMVRDHGPGIDDDDLPFVFDRFYRAPAARALPGSGLGLAIVRQVAESHGGKVVAERAEGGGALIRMSFPAIEEAQRAP